ncbi:MAG TPA: choice-of-anchor tandem repeat GloVer-containing protein [Verrucomicrobiae bacterium]|nr:choice-of-anchor tandem repeat GloVer-containing protein [Verrucomicrobiae bacterium]
MTKLFFLLLLLTGAGFGSFGQTLSTLYSFGTLTNEAGVMPEAQLTEGSDRMLYGTTSEGGGGRGLNQNAALAGPVFQGKGGLLQGAIFAIKPDGTGFKIVKQFTNRLDGSEPRSALVLAGNFIYGTTSAGGANNGGTIFKLNTDGSGFSVLKDLPEGSYDRNPAPVHIVNDPSIDTKPPLGGLLLSGDTLFGTTRSGGSAAGGTVFKIHTDGTGYSVMKEFTGPDGAAPCGDLLLSGSTLFGTTSLGGSTNYGTVFKVNMDGTAFEVIKNFLGTPAGEGATPLGGLVQSGITLFGTTLYGGATNFFSGTVFKINPDGTGFEVLKSFSDDEYLGLGPVGRLNLSGDTLFGVTTKASGNSLAAYPQVFSIKTNGSAADLIRLAGSPRAGVTLVNGKLFGSTYLGDSWYGVGTLFSFNTNGSGFSIIHAFSGSSGGPAGPSPLISWGDFLFGTTVSGGASNAGTVFRAQKNGAGLTILKEFTGGEDGRNPGTRLTISGNTLYGVTADHVLYKLNTDGTGFEVVHSFGPVNLLSPPGSPVLLNGALYETTSWAGDGGHGSVYKVNTDGTGFSIIKSFYEADGYPPENLAVGDNLLYGTTGPGGASGHGGIYKIGSDDSYTPLYRFSEMTGPVGPLTPIGNTIYGAGFSLSSQPLILKLNTDGTGLTTMAQLSGNLAGDVSPNGLILAGSNLIGVTRGSSDAIFQINANGTNVALIYQFAQSIGLNGDLLLDGTTLYGTTSFGGAVGEGTLFGLDLRPRLSITQSGSSVRLSWPSYASSAKLEQTTGLTAQSWSAVSAPTINNGTTTFVNLDTANTVTFFRLVN